MTHTPDDPSDDVIFQLRRANPVPETGLDRAQQQRAERTLQDILSQPTATRQSRRLRTTQWVAVAAAAVLVVGVGVGVVPQQQARAQAEEVLTRAAEASLSKLEPASSTSADYLRRVDEFGDAQVTSVLRTDAAGTVDVKQESTAELPEELRSVTEEIAHQQPLNPEADPVAALAERDADTAVRDALNMLLSPGLSAQHQSDLYVFIARAPGNRVVDHDEAREGDLVTIERAGDGLRFQLLPQSGQLVSVSGLAAPGVTTTVDAAGIIGCVNTTGVSGPEVLSLACADENYLLTDLSWQGWNSPEATASGTALINDCDPDCASGRFHELPAEVRASEKRACGFNVEVYTRIEVDYSEEVQRADAVATPQSIEFGCD